MRFQRVFLGLVELVRNPARGRRVDQRLELIGIDGERSFGIGDRFVRIGQQQMAVADCSIDIRVAYVDTFEPARNLLKNRERFGVLPRCLESHALLKAGIDASKKRVIDAANNRLCAKGRPTFSACG